MRSFQSWEPSETILAWNEAKNINTLTHLTSLPCIPKSRKVDTNSNDHGFCVLVMNSLNKEWG